VPAIRKRAAENPGGKEKQAARLIEEDHQKRDPKKKKKTTEIREENLRKKSGPFSRREKRKGDLKRARGLFIGCRKPVSDGGGGRYRN